MAKYSMAMACCRSLTWIVKALVLRDQIGRPALVHRGMNCRGMCRPFVDIRYPTPLILNGHFATVSAVRRR